MKLRLKTHPKVRDLKHFLRYVAGRFFEDRCPEVAASLSYTALLALVPLMAVGLALIAAFPVLHDMRKVLQAFIFQSFVPAVGETVQNYLDQFVSNIDKLTVFGIVGLAVTAIMLLATIEDAFNHIWQVKRQRRIVIRFLRFWAVLTLGPLLFGVSLTLPSYFFAQARTYGVDLGDNPLGQAARLAPPFFELVGFFLIYLLLPNRSVQARHALIGALIAMVLFEALKKSFALYITAFPSYETVYGALSVLPILLLWVYLAWLVVLFGAVISASLPIWRYGDLTVARTPARRLEIGLGVLAALAHAHRRGGGITEQDAWNAAAAAPIEVDLLLDRLRAEKIVAKDRDHWVLARDLDTLTLYDFCRLLGIGFEPSDFGPEGWQGRASRLLEAVENSNRQIMQIPLSQLLLGAEARIRPEPALPFSRR